MALIPFLRRKRPATPAERVLKLTSVALRALPAVRTARFTVKVARRVPVLLAAGAVAFAAIRRLRGRGSGGGDGDGGGGGGGVPTPGVPSPGGAAAAQPAAATAPRTPVEGATATVTPHGDPLGTASDDVRAEGDPTGTRHGISATAVDAPAGDAVLAEVPPEPGAGDTAEVETGGGPSPALAGPDETAFPATPEGAAAANELIEDLPPNESGPGHEIPPAPAEDELDTPPADPDVPNESGPGHHPDEGDRPG